MDDGGGRETARRTEPLAFVAFVASLAQLVLLLPATILAIVTAHLALRRIRRSHGGLKGNGYAVSALTLSYLGLGLQAIAVVFVAALVCLALAVGNGFRDFGIEFGPMLAPLGSVESFLTALDADARAHGLSSPRDPAVIARVAFADRAVGPVRTAGGVDILHADRAAWERSAWRARIDVPDFGPVCMTIPDDLRPVALDIGGCARG